MIYPRANIKFVVEPATNQEEYRSQKIHVDLCYPLDWDETEIMVDTIGNFPVLINGKWELFSSKDKFQ